MRRAIVWLLPGALALGLAFPGLVLADAPTADAVPSATGLEDQVLTVHLSGDDADGDPLTFSPAIGPSAGSLGAAYNVSCTGDTLNPPSHCTADIDYTPNLNYAGADSFTYVTNDGVSDSASAQVDISLTGVNDPPSFTDGGGKTVLEDSGPASYSGWASAISRGGGADESGQTVSFTAGNLSNAGLFSVAPQVSASGTLTFTPATNANGSSTVDVTAQDNGGTTNGGNDTSTIHQITITVTAVNDVPSFTKGGNQTVLEDSGAASVPGWATSPSTGPSNESAQTYSYQISSDDHPTFFSSGPAVATNGTLTFTPAANAAGVATIGVVIKDNGGTANGGVDTSAEQIFTITITGVNDPPTFSNAGSESGNEDTAGSVPGWVTASNPGGGADESGQTISYDISNVSNPSLFSAGPAVSNAGTLTWTPAANANGSSTVDITAHDSGGTSNGGNNLSAPSTITITVNAVNDAPGFTAGSDEGVNEDSGPASFPLWATNPSVGPSDESAQTYSYVVSSNSNPSLFGTAPAVATNGTLTFTPAANRFGTATVGVRIQDNGGTANGGVDISGEQTFTITVTNVDDPPNAVNDLHVPIGENAPATAINVLANDTYLPDPVETLGITAVTQGAHGTVVITGSNGVGGTGLTYQPAAGYYGSDQFTYTIQDSGGVATDQGTVQVDIAKDVTAPVFTSMGQSLRQNVTMVTALPIRIAWIANDGTGVGIKSYLLQRSIDGGSYTTITLSTLLTTSYSTSVTAGHTYRYRVRATDKNGNVSAFKYTVAFKGTIYQDTSSLAVYSGTWGTATSSTNYIGGTTHYAGTAARSVSITTTMRDVAFVGPISATRGTASIYVDNVLIGTTLNETSATTFYKRVIWATHFASIGTHTIRFVVTGPARIDLDCFLILR